MEGAKDWRRFVSSRKVTKAEEKKKIKRSIQAVTF